MSVLLVFAHSFVLGELTRDEARKPAVEAVIWGMPLVNFDAMRQAYFRDGKATYGDIIFWSKPGTWKLQCLTPNTSVRYAFSFVNTSQAGPVVVDLPASGDASLMGTILDAWQVPMTDIGLAGEDQGKGGKYLHATRLPRRGTRRLFRLTHENFQLAGWSSPHREERG